MQDLSAVQTSLDDSYSSADAQLNLLDLSAADLMSINDASELRNYILAAKRQVEMMQNKRAKSNIGQWLASAFCTVELENILYYSGTTLVPQLYYGTAWQ